MTSHCDERNTVLTRSVAAGFVALIGLASPPAHAQTTVFSDNGHPWEVRDADMAAGGAIDDGGAAFNQFGGLNIRVLNGIGTELTTQRDVGGFGLIYDNDQRFTTTTPVDITNVLNNPLVTVERAIFIPTGTDYVRYIDTFTNVTTMPVRIQVLWGGVLESDALTTLAATSSGDLEVGVNDSWVTTHENDTLDPAGPATAPALGFAVGNNAIFRGAFDWSQDDPVDWPGSGNGNLAFLYEINMAPGQTHSLAYFLFRGLAEDETGPNGQMPMTGEAIAEAVSVVSALAGVPDFDDLTPAEVDAIINWNIGLEAGQDCTTPAECTSGLCIDGVCCATSCNRGCEACSRASGGTMDGTCTPLSAGTECRPNVGDCDATELCDGTSPVCPPDEAQPDGTACPDSSRCNGDEVCMDGFCSSGEPLECAAGEVCVDNDGCVDETQVGNDAGPTGGSLDVVPGGGGGCSATEPAEQGALWLALACLIAIITRRSRCDRPRP